MAYFKKGEKNRKALSDIVSTLLILLLVFVAIAIVWLVVRNVIKQGTEQISLGKFTLDLQIEQVSIDKSLNGVSVVVKRNVGEGEFVGIKFIISDGEQSESFSVNQTLEEGEKNFFNFNLARINCNNIQEIEIAPIFRLSSGKEVTGDIKDTWENSEGIIYENCIPYCISGAECGLDGCGGFCGNNNCSGSTPNCVNYHCSVQQCIPSCAGKTCGSDGCAGTCGNCALANAISGCSAVFNCEISTCNSGYANCDSNVLNGCETQLGTNSNCGSCGNVCNSTQACSNNVCVNNAVNSREYLSSPLSDGTCPKPLTLDSVRGGCVCNSPECHFDCRDQIFDGNWASKSYLIRLSDGSVISNCTIKNYYSPSIVYASSASNVLVEFSHFENITSGTIGVDGHAFVIGSTGHNITVRNTIFKNIGADGIQLGNSGTSGSITDVLLIGNSFEITMPRILNGRLNGENGVDLKYVSENIKVLNNSFKGFTPCLKASQECTGDLGSALVLNRGGSTGYARNVLVEGNTFRDSSIGVGALYGSNHVIRNNFFYDVRRGIYITSSVSSILIEHNTIASIREDLYGYGDPMFIRCEPCETCTARNNLFFGFNANEECAVSQNNILFSDESQSSNTFMDYNSGNLHLKFSASSLINQGVSTGTVKDIDSQTRDSNPDIGADEFF